MNANRRVPDDPASGPLTGNGARVLFAAHPCTLRRQSRRNPERNGPDCVQEEVTGRDGGDQHFAGETSPQGNGSSIIATPKYAQDRNP